MLIKELTMEGLGFDEILDYCKQNGIEISAEIDPHCNEYCKFYVFKKGKFIRKVGIFESELRSAHAYDYLENVKNSILYDLKDLMFKYKKDKININSTYGLKPWDIPEINRFEFDNKFIEELGLLEKENNNVIYNRIAVITRPNIEKVIFNDPATIVYWADGDKTVVKCQVGDKFDPEKGLAMAIVKKMYENKGNYNDIFKKWLPKEGM